MAEVSAIKDLARYGELFTADRYRPGFVPWESASAKTVSGFWLPKTSYGQVIRVLSICSEASRSPMIASRVPALRVPSRRPYPRVAADLQTTTGVEERRDPSAVAPAGGPAAADGRPAETDLDRPGAVRHAADAHPALTPWRAALVHHLWVPITYATR